MKSAQVREELRRAALLVGAIVAGAHCSASRGEAHAEPRGAGGSSGAAAGSAGTGGNVGAGVGGLPDAGAAPDGSSGSAGAGAVAGNGSPPLDAGSDVWFEWPETPPGSGCKPGRYSGTFACTYKDPQGLTMMPVTGPISLTLEESQQGEFLDVREGVLDGTANTFFSLRADLSGKLDCATAQFQGTLVNGTYSGLLFVNGTFTGQLSSQYDRVKFAFVAGIWSMAVVGPPGGTCDGTWSANYVGP